LRLKANLKRHVLIPDLKIKIELLLRRQAGSAFQSVGADTLKDLSPKYLFIFPAGRSRSVPEFKERNE